MAGAWWKRISGRTYSVRKEGGANGLRSYRQDRNCVSSMNNDEPFLKRMQKGFSMKKFWGFVICIVMVLSMLSVAYANVTFSFSTTQTSGFPIWKDDYQWSNGKNWHFTWTGDTNLASNCRAVVRIRASDGRYASALWVYSWQSTNYHPYSDFAAYGNAETTPSGRLDDRDIGQTLIVEGTFYN